MDLEAIEHRIEYLEEYKKKLLVELSEKEEEIKNIQGAIDENWRYHEKNLEVHEFGGIRYDGRTKIRILPEFGGDEAIKEGIERRLDAQVEGDAEIAKEARKDKGKQDAQGAVDEISRMNEDGE